MDKVKWATITDYARVMGVHPNTISTQLRMGKLTGKKVGRVWRVAVDADTDMSVLSEGEEAKTAGVVEQVVEEPTKQDTEPVVEPTELTGLAKEESDLDLEMRVLDKREQVKQKRLQVESGIAWDEYLEKVEALTNKEGALLDTAALLKGLEEEVEAERRGLTATQSAMQDWLDTVAGKVELVVGVVAELSTGTYKYPASVGGLGSKTVTRTAPLLKHQIDELVKKITEVLAELLEIPRPGFNIEEKQYTDDAGGDELFDTEKEPEEG